MIPFHPGLRMSQVSATVLLVTALLTAGCRSGGRATGSAPSPAAPSSPVAGPGRPAETETAGAASPAPQGRVALTGVTLDQALALAATHPAIVAAASALNAAEGDLAFAGRLPNPAAVIRVESSPLNSDSRGEGQAVAGVVQTIPIGGRLDASRRVAEARRDRARHLLDEARLEVTRRVRGAFATALCVGEFARLQEESWATAGERVRLEQSRLAAGDSIPDDLARAEIERERLLAARDGARADRAEALLALAGAIGQPDLEVGSVEGNLEAALELPTLERLVTRLGAHPRLAAAWGDVESGERGLLLAEAQRIPDLNLDLLYRRYDATEKDTFDVGVAVAIPLFDSGQGRVREAAAELSGARARAHLARRELETELRASHSRLARALGESRILHDAILPRTEALVRSLERRLTAGDASLAELLTARREHQSARSEWLDSVREAMRVWGDLESWMALDRR
ncbi:MAG: TolC family protein [Planctomycetes bacterium]|nr:TolC family protein [Planctomycetota bacterium]